MPLEHRAGEMQPDLNSQGGMLMHRDDDAERDPSLFVTQAAHFDPNPCGAFDWEGMLEAQNSMRPADGGAAGRDGDGDESPMERGFVEGPDGRELSGIMNSLFSTTGVGGGLMSKLPSSSPMGASTGIGSSAASTKRRPNGALGASQSSQP